MVLDVVIGPTGHLNSFVGYIKSRKLQKAMIEKDWGNIAHGYNGKGYKKFKYHTRIEREYKNLKNKICILFFAGFSVACTADNFSASIVTNSNEKNNLRSVMSKNFAKEDVDLKQITKISNNEKYFYIVPTISYLEKQQGCYIQIINQTFKITDRYLIEESLDAKSCDSIIAIYACKLSNDRGIGVLAGIRLGADNYYTSNTFFNLVNQKLVENSKLTKQVNDIDSVSMSKKTLGCIK